MLTYCFRLLKDNMKFDVFLIQKLYTSFQLLSEIQHKYDNTKQINRLKFVIFKIINIPYFKKLQFGKVSMTNVLIGTLSLIFYERSHCYTMQSSLYKWWYQ